MSEFNLLVVAATAMEIAPLTAELTPLSARVPAAWTSYSLNGRHIDVLITGVGMMATAFWCSRAMAGKRYDSAINLGVCGSFDSSLEPGQVVHVIRDRVSELGAQDGDGFLNVHQLGLLGADEFPFQAQQLVNGAPPSSRVLAALPQVSGITVNTVHGEDTAIAQAKTLFNPQVESMEGAAFLYSCLQSGIPFAQVRAISNRVERRNRDAWKLSLAIQNLKRVAIELLSDIQTG